MVLAAEDSQPLPGLTAFAVPSDLNLLYNSSFESGGLGSRPQGWNWILNSGGGNTVLSNGSVRSGTLSLKFEDISASPSHPIPLGVTQPTTTTINGRSYVYSVNVRTFNLVGTPTLRIGFLGTVPSTDPNSGKSGFSDYSADKFQDFNLTSSNTSDWKTFSFTYTNAALGKYPFIQISGYEGGKIYIDDASLYEVITTSSIVSAATGNPSVVDLSKINYQAVTKIGDGSITVDSSGNIYPTGGLNLGGSLGLSGNRFGNGYLSALDDSGNLSVGGTGTLGNLSITSNATISGVLTVNGNTTFSGTTTLNPGFTTGSVIFQSSSGLTQNNSNFFWDNTNNRLGIGTTTPSYNLDVSGTVGAKNINNIRYANQFSGADAGAKIAACISDLPSDGGVCDARGLLGAQTLTTNPFAGITKPVVLLLGPTTFTFSQKISMTSNVSIIGSGQGTTVLKEAGGTNLVTAIEVQANSKNILMQDFTLDLNSSNNTGTTQSNAIALLSGVSDSTIRNIIVQNFNGLSGSTGVGISLAATTNVQIINNTLRNLGKAGSASDAIYTSGVRNRIVGNNIESAFDTGIVAENSTDSVIANNDILNTPQGIAISNLAGSTTYGGAISGNVITGASATNQAAISVYRASGAGSDQAIAITGNVIRASTDGNGIWVQSSNRISVTGNTITGVSPTVGKSGILVQDSNNMTLSGNTVEGSGGIGINIQGAVGFVLNGNVVIDNSQSVAGTYSGIVISNGVAASTNGTISGNISKGGNQGRGLYVTGGSDKIFVASNDLRFNNNNPGYLSDASGNIRLGYNLTNATANSSETIDYLKISGQLDISNGIAINLIGNGDPFNGYIIPTAAKQIDIKGLTNGIRFLNNAGTVANLTFSDAGLITLGNTNPSISASSTNRLDLLANNATLSIGGISGNVGIGTTTPGNLLDVSGSSTSTASAMIRNTSTNAGIAGLGIQLSSTTLDNTSRFVNFLDKNGTIIGKIQAANTTSVNYAANGTDFAEWFGKENTSESFVPGDVVVAGSTKQSVAHTTSPYDSKILGIVSTHPAFTGGVEGSDKVVVALTGQVPINIDPASSAINPGDALTSSTTAGLATKATQSGPIVAKAQESWTPGSGVSQIMAYVNVSWFDPNTATTTNSGTFLDAHILNTLQADGAVTFKSDVTFQGRGLFMALVEFFDNVIFHKNIEVVGRATFDDKDMAGTATIKARATQVQVNFQTSYTNSPVVTATPISGVKLDWYRVTNISPTGFTIEISPSQSQDISFNWIALAVNQPQTTVGGATPATPSPSPMVTPLSSPLVSPTPVVSPSVTLTPSPVSSSSAVTPTPLPSPTSTPSALLSPSPTASVSPSIRPSPTP